MDRDAHRTLEVQLSHGLGTLEAVVGHSAAVAADDGRAVALVRIDDRKHVPRGRARARAHAEVGCADGAPEGARRDPEGRGACKSRPDDVAKHRWV